MDMVLRKKQTEVPSRKGTEIMDSVYRTLKSFRELYDIDNAYRHYGQAINKPTRAYPEYTYYSNNSASVIDHIMHSKNNVKVKALLRIPEPSEFGYQSLPNQEYPSDHLPVAAIVEILWREMFSNEY